MKKILSDFQPPSETDTSLPEVCFSNIIDPFSTLYGHHESWSSSSAYELNDFYSNAFSPFASATTTVKSYTEHGITNSGESVTNILYSRDRVDTGNTDESEETEELIKGVKGQLHVFKTVKMVMLHWGPIEPINPEIFLLKLLSRRGYDCSMIPALSAHQKT
jgi:hypothetical protein